MNISPIDPIPIAWNHMVRILFQPFEFKKWLLLGFCAFLAQCGENSGSSGSSGSAGNESGQFAQARTWIESQPSELLMTIAICGGILIILTALFTIWLSSLGKFMLLDGIVKNRGAVSEPWGEYKSEGNSLFLFRIVFGLLAIVGLIITGGIPVLIALPDIQSEIFRGASIAAIVIAACLLLPYAIACITFKFFLDCFVVPTMYLKRVRVVEGVNVAWNALCKGHIGSAIVLMILMFLFGIVASIIAIAGICATCCIGALPYVSSVLLLPITVFFTCYTLCYIQQFGEGWQFNLWGTGNCSCCGYSREGLDNSQKCPECGLKLQRSD